MSPLDPLSPLTTSAGAAPESTASMPDDWATQWDALLRARAAAQAASTAASPTRPAPSDGAGNAGRPASTGSAAWLALYHPLLRARRAPAGAMPWALAQLGQSLDGCVATASGDSYFVTGAHSLLHLHRLRALCDAVLVGAGTVAADDPQLTTRRVPGPHPARVLLDPAARLDGRARALHDGVAPTLWLCDHRQAGVARARLARAVDAMRADAPAHTTTGPRFDAEVLPVEGLLDPADPTRGPDLACAFRALAARGLRVLLVEGGGVTVSRCWQAGLLARLHLVIAPVIIGAGRRGLQHPGPARMADCLRPPARRHALGEDVLWDLDLRPPAAPSIPAA